MANKADFRLTVVAFLSVLTLSVSAFAGVYGGGTGEPDNPYLIYDPNHLQQIGANHDDLNAHFLMTADINLADYTGTQFNIIGDLDTPFTGVFDGNGHTISNFTYKADFSDYIGLFGWVKGSNAVIKNLTLIDPNIDIRINRSGSSSIGSLIGTLNSGTISGCSAEGGSVRGYSRIGGLVGSNNGTVSNCYTTIAVTGSKRIGGLVGSNNGTISDCYTTGTITGDNYIGGLVGSNNGTISDCYTTGTITGDDYIGGLVGSNNGNGAISDCYTAGTITGKSYIGGLVGQNNGTISSCYATTIAVMGYTNAGGLVGENGGVISNCYATTIAVMGYMNTGGLVGRNSDTISHCYATGFVLGYQDIGGLVGYSYNDTVSASFWDTETTGQSTSDGGQGKTTAEMHDPNTFIDAGWDFTTPIWKMCHEPNYPRLEWEQCQELVEASLSIKPKVINRHSRSKRIFAWIHLPEGITKDQIDTNEPLMLYPGEIEAEHQSVFQNQTTGLVSILALFDRADLLEATDANGQVQLEVFGSFKTGCDFYGSDTVRIISQPPKRLRRRR